MLISAFAALALFAAPEAAQSGGAETASAVAPAAAAEAQPATRKVCTTVQVSGSNLPKRKCRTAPVKAETPKPTEEAKAETSASQ